MSSESVPGFDHVSVAAQMREIIESQAKKVVLSQAPKPNYARVISINFAALTASVWFPGDDQPVSVNIFTDRLPASWQEQINPSSGGVNTSYAGYGSLVGESEWQAVHY
jgi:hypothetical protein